LNYARQARNIQNKPVVNLDKTQQELRKLRMAVKAWMMKAVSVKFDHLIDHSAPETEGDQVAALLDNPEVKEFVSSVSHVIDGKLDTSSAPSPRKVRLSVMPGSYTSPFKGPSRSRVTPVKALQGVARKLGLADNWDDVPVGAGAQSKKGGTAKAGSKSSSTSMPAIAEDQADSDNTMHPSSRGGLPLGLMSPGGVAISGTATDIDPEETERLVARMLEVRLFVTRTLVPKSCTVSSYRLCVM
jgi:hypothetical protein